jgi:glycosyltransferase involved in cell wall biosynthesis
MISKGLDTYLALAVRAAGEELNLRFVLAGPVPGSHEQAMIDQTRARLGAQFEYRGPVHRQDKIDYLRGVDVFVFPTRYRFEAQPNVLLEALCCGCAVVSAQRGCIAEDLSEMGGWTVPEEHAAKVKP